MSYLYEKGSFLCKEKNYAENFPRRINLNDYLTKKYVILHAVESDLRHAKEKTRIVK